MALLVPLFSRTRCTAFAVALYDLCFAEGVSATLLLVWSCVHVCVRVECGMGGGKEGVAMTEGALEDQNWRSYTRVSYDDRSERCFLSEPNPGMATGFEPPRHADGGGMLPALDRAVPGARHLATTGKTLSEMGRDSLTTQMNLKEQ